MCSGLVSTVTWVSLHSSTGAPVFRGHDLGSKAGWEGRRAQVRREEAKSREPQGRNVCPQLYIHIHSHTLTHSHTDSHGLTHTWLHLEFDLHGPLLRSEAAGEKLKATGSR